MVSESVFSMKTLGCCTRSHLLSFSELLFSNSWENVLSQLCWVGLHGMTQFYSNTQNMWLLGIFITMLNQAKQKWTVEVDLVQAGISLCSGVNLSPMLRLQNPFLWGLQNLKLSYPLAPYSALRYFSWFEKQLLPSFYGNYFS